MKHLHEQPSGSLIWTQAQATLRAFELKTGAEVVGTLRWASSFGSLADAVAADGHWTFKRIGFLSPQISVRLHGSDANLARFKPQWTGDGGLEFPSGQCFRWSGSGLWRSRWSFTNVSGERLVDFEPCDSFFKTSASVKITPTGREMAELSLLVLLGWYLMLLRSDDDTAVAASVTCAVG